MAHKIPRFLLFLSLVVGGAVLAVSSSSWFFIWVGFTLNLIGFIPILAKEYARKQAGSSVKYFLVQVIGSVTFLVSRLGLFWGNIEFRGLRVESGLSFVLIGSLFLKLGMYPFYGWVPKVLKDLSLLDCILVLIVQKIGPLFVLIYFLAYSETRMLLCFCAAASRLVGGVGGFNQTQSRSLLAYSSIGHSGWIGLSCLIGWEVLCAYFVLYSFVLLWLLACLGIKNVLFIQEAKYVAFRRVFVSFCFLRLGGLPPLLGFVPKWLVISHAFRTSLYFWLVPLVVGSLVNLFYYLRFIIPFLTQYFRYEGLKTFDLGIMGGYVSLRCFGLILIVFFLSMYSTFTFHVKGLVFKRRS